MSVNLYRADPLDAEAFLSRLSAAEDAIYFARLPFKTQFSFGKFRCRARVLGNRQRFAIALSIFIGRIPYSAENRALRRAMLELDGLNLANGAAKLGIKADNWAIASLRFAVLAEPSRMNLSYALTSKLMQVEPALAAVQAQTIND